MTENKPGELGVSNLAISALPLLLDERRLRCWFLAVFRGSVTECPLCSSPLIGKVLRTFAAGRRTKCQSCGGDIRLWQGTPLHAMKLSHSQFFLLVCLSGLDVPGADIARIIGISKSTEHAWRNRLQTIVIKDVAAKQTRVGADGN